MFFKLLLIPFILIFTGCAALTGQKVNISMYAEPEHHTSNTNIEFSHSKPLFFVKGKPSDKTIQAIKWTLGSFKTKTAKLYSDASNCVDYKIFDLIKEPNRKFNINANEMLTFEYSSIEMAKDKTIWCPNIFSFIPEENTSYTVEKSIHIYDIEYAKCDINIYKNGDPKKTIKVISRDNPPLFWNQSSPKCNKNEINNPIWVNSSNPVPFKCVTKIGRRNC